MRRSFKASPSTLKKGVLYSDFAAFQNEGESEATVGDPKFSPNFALHRVKKLGEGWGKCQNISTTV